MTNDNPLEEFMPKCPLMARAWIGSLSWALGNKNILSAFRSYTGNNYQPGRTPLEDMIDDATGTKVEFIRAFARWHNENIWGDINLAAGDAPATIIEEPTP